jgi:outer membrane protein OmpA-like peptidoglycan-associated protein
MFKRIVVPSLFAILASAGLSIPADAGLTLISREPTVDEMVCALDPQCTKPFADPRLSGVTTNHAIHAFGSFDRTVHFAFDSTELTADAHSELYEVANCLMDPRLVDVSIVINGYTDAVGSAEYNQGLSERRAEAVRQYLISAFGVDPSRLSAKGHGKSEPLLPGEPANALNRRVSFVNPYKRLPR